MTDSETPIVKRSTYKDFATLTTTVTHLSPLDGNSGHSLIRFDIETGVIWFGEEERDNDSPQSFTMQLVGSSEHRQIAQALRDIADHLDAAAQRERSV